MVNLALSSWDVDIVKNALESYYETLSYFDVYLFGGSEVVTEDVLKRLSVLIDSLTLD